jgi:3'-phosphoadenosine 5'-phosphosulfate sulfotransferase (PAPS reductase)/FAD synthetase
MADLKAQVQDVVNIEVLYDEGVGAWFTTIGGYRCTGPEVSYDKALDAFRQRLLNGDLEQQIQEELAVSMAEPMVSFAPDVMGYSTENILSLERYEHLLGQVREMALILKGSADH